MVQGKKILAASLFAAASSLTMQSASHAATYTEFGADAGQTLPTAMATASAAAPAGTALSTIFGTFNVGADADLFAITITAPGTTFSATTNNIATNGTFLDTALFLFDSTGHAIATNDDANGTTLSSTLPTGNSLFATLSAGTYYLGVSGSGNEPVNSVNDLLFAGTGGDPTTVRGAAPSLNPTTLSTFNGNVSYSQPGSYEIDLTGVTTAVNPNAVPEPTTWTALALGSLAAGATIFRRRSVRA